MTDRTRAQRKQRVLNIRLLLHSADDYIPQTQGIDLGAVPGPAPSAKVCAACRGKGVVQFKPCRECSADGYIHVGKESQAEVDPYVFHADREEIKPIGFTPQRERTTMTPEQRDADIARLQSNVRARAGIVGPFAWEVAEQRMNRAGSYVTLRAILSWSREHHPWAYTAALTASQRPLEDKLVIQEAMALLFFESRWPGPVRVPPWLAQDERPAKVGELHAQGLTPNQISRRTGIPRGSVKRMVAKLK